MTDLREHPAIDQRPTQTTPDNPRDELHALIVATLNRVDQEIGGFDDHPIGPFADAIVGLFDSVRDAWEETLGGESFGELPGESRLCQRYIVAKLHRQNVVLRRVTERSVGE